MTSKFKILFYKKKRTFIRIFEEKIKCVSSIIMVATCLSWIYIELFSMTHSFPEIKVFL